MVRKSEEQKCEYGKEREIIRSRGETIAEKKARVTRQHTQKSGDYQNVGMYCNGVASHKSDPPIESAVSVRSLCDCA